MSRDGWQPVDSATLRDEGIRERMSGNERRCGALSNIVAARLVLAEEVLALMSLPSSVRTPRRMRRAWPPAARYYCRYAPSWVHEIDSRGSGRSRQSSGMVPVGVRIALKR